MSTTGTYEDRGYGQGTLPMGTSPVMLVVDFQQAFTQRRLPMGGGPHVVAAVERSVPVLEAARLARVPVIHTAVAYDPSGADLGLWKYKVPALAEVTRGSVHAEVEPKLWDPSDVLILKQWPSAFAGTDLKDRLVTLWADMLFIMGCTTSGCIRATVIDAFSEGFPPFIVDDCCGDQDDGPHEANIDDCTRRYAERINAVATIDLLVGLAK